jgi:hypothetical protein
MAGQLNSFVQHLYSLWNSGNDPCLNLECNAGKAQIHLQLNLHFNRTFNHSNANSLLAPPLNNPTVT